jgi:hypothetical protein
VIRCKLEIGRLILKWDEAKKNTRAVNYSVFL